MRLAFSRLAQGDLRSIGAFIQRDNPTAARRFVAELRERCARILDAPRGGVMHSELGRGMRSVPFRRYVIYYDVEDDLVIVQRVIHSARDMGSIFQDE